MTGDFPQISEAQVVARDAEKIFEGLLSSELWNDVKVPQERDFGLDYRVEAIGDGELRGCEFLVQLKGFRCVPESSRVPVTVSTSTLRYWKNKILPILVVAIDCTAEKGYFAWFDKDTVVSPKRKTHTIHIPKGNELLDFRLQKSLEPYYEQWVTQFKDRHKLAFYKRLFSDSLLVLDVLLNTVGSLLFTPQLSEEDAKAYREERMRWFLMIISVHLHDLALYKSQVDLQQNPIDWQLDGLLSNVLNLYDSFAVKVADHGAFGIAMVNPERAYASLPALSFAFSEINQLLRTHLL
jgi:hypothetical protein